MDNNAINKKLEEILNKHVSMKETSNNLINSNIDQAIENYNIQLEELNKIIDVDNNNIDLKNTTGLNLLAKIKHQRVLIVSNLSLCYAKLNLHEKSIEKDELIINSLDHKFIKSWARLIEQYIKLEKFQPSTNLENLQKANFYADEFLKLEDNSTISTNVLDILDSMNNEKNLNKAFRFDKNYKKIYRPGTPTPTSLAEKKPKYNYYAIVIIIILALFAYYYISKLGKPIDIDMELDPSQLNLEMDMNMDNNKDL